MASADELIREAQYAFRNISHGSTDEKKYRARAEKYARRIIRQYPASVEASQARQILAQMNVQIPVQSIAVEPQRSAAAEFEKNHSADSGHTKNPGRPMVSIEAAFQQSGISEEWRDLARRFMDLSSGKKKMITVVFFFLLVFFFPFSILIYSGLIIFYATNTARLKTHLSQLLNKLESN